jgi:Protein of unknown function (DUF1549)/Protein of unknown function (DUF1553)
MRFGPFLILVLLTSPAAAQPRLVSFENDIQPILTRVGCNAGACHGKQRGQNGFQLSLLAFDHDFDYGALVSEGRGRRVFQASPEQSLIILKPTAQVPHGGGKKLIPGDGRYEVILDWIKQGAPRTIPNDRKLERITVEPTQRIAKFNEETQLRVTAYYSDGSKRDVTALSTYQSNEAVYAAVDANGKIKAGPIPGEAAVMSRFMDKFAVTSVVVPYPEKVDPAVYETLPREHFIDRLVWDKLKQLNLTPSDLVGDATFLRRAFLDVIGRIPTPDEARAFLADKSADKRTKLIDQLLGRPECADFWANKWADLLRPNPYHAGIKATYNLDAWIRESFRQNKPYDQFVREIITANGSTFRDGAAVFYRNRRDPAELTTMVSQLFLGIRLDCARCHHHPFEVYGQDEFYRFAAYFSRIGRRGQGISAPISGGEEMIFPGKTGQVKHPINGKTMTPSPLFGKTKVLTDDDDPREALADWIVSADNPYFTRVAVNRMWADIMGRGLVDMVDDLRATNPASNPQLLDALADDFKRNKYNLKKVLKTILTSRVYALSSVPNSQNSSDIRNYSRHYRQRLRAEVLLDAICDVAGLPETFAAMPQGSRATQLWTHRSQSIFLDAFGRPNPNEDPPCERTSDTTVVQALHLMNAAKLHTKITDDKSRAAALAGSKKTNEEIVAEVYLLLYSRYPTDDEKKGCLTLLEKGPRRTVIEDLMWAMINTPEFTFKD